MSKNRNVQAEDKSADMDLMTCEGVIHPTTAEGMLEGSAHEAVSIAGTLQNLEMDCKHCHVEDNGCNDQAQRSGNKMLRKTSR